MPYCKLKHLWPILRKLLVYWFKYYLEGSSPCVWSWTMGLGPMTSLLRILTWFTESGMHFLLWSGERLLPTIMVWLHEGYCLPITYRTQDLQPRKINDEFSSPAAYIEPSNSLYVSHGERTIQLISILVSPCLITWTCGDRVLPSISGVQTKNNGNRLYCFGGLWHLSHKQLIGKIPILKIMRFSWKQNKTVFSTSFRI